MLSERDVVQALPQSGFLHDYVCYASNCTDAHASYHLGAGLALLSQSCALDLNFPFGQPVYPNVFSLSVGESSVSRKSVAIAIARDVLQEAIPNSVGAVPGSREALIDDLRQNPRQVIFYSEFGAFLASTERGYLNPLKTAFTEAYDCSPLSRALVKKQGTEARSPRLSLLCGSTLDFLERHTEPSDWTGGFMARFLAFYARRERNWDIPPGDPAGRARVISYLRNLDAMATPMVRGVCLGFDSAARARWSEWYRETSNYLDPARETAGAVARAPAHALKIATLLAWDYGQARSGQHWYVTCNELEPAIAIAKLHISSVLEIGDHLAATRDMRERRAVLNCIKPTPRTLGAILREAKLLKRRGVEILETLLIEGAIKRVSIPGVAGGDCFHLPEETASGEGPNVVQLFGSSSGTVNSSVTAESSSLVDEAPAGGVFELDS